MGKSILLADDSATIRKVVELTFSDTDVHVESVGTGSEALAKLEFFHPDIVLADVVMPGPGGYEICRKIKGSERPVPVLLLVGTFETFDHDLARECGADGCLLKPFESKTLLDRVEHLLSQRSALAQEGVEPSEEEQGEAEVVDDRPAPVKHDARVPVHVGVSVEDPAPEPDLPAGLSAESIDAIARAVVQRLSEDVVRQIAREVVPQVAEAVVRQRIRELEREDS